MLSLLFSLAVAVFQSVLFEAMVKNLALHDELGRPRKKELIVKVWNQKTNKVRSCLGFPVITSSVFEPFSHLQCNMLDVATVSRSKKWDHGITL